jgi:Zn-finger nucleic acid-binding protein
MVELHIAERQGVEIDYCPRCRGTWWQCGDLDKTLERSRRVMSSRCEDEDEYDARYRRGGMRPRRRKPFLVRLSSPKF